MDRYAEDIAGVVRVVVCAADGHRCEVKIVPASKRSAPTGLQDPVHGIDRSALLRVAGLRAGPTGPPPQPRPADPAAGPRRPSRRGLADRRRSREPADASLLDRAQGAVPSRPARPAGRGGRRQPPASSRCGSAPERRVGSAVSGRGAPVRRRGTGRSAHRRRSRQSIPLTDQPRQLRPVTNRRRKVQGIEPNDQSPDLDIFYLINLQIP